MTWKIHSLLLFSNIPSVIVLVWVIGYKSWSQTSALKEFFGSSPVNISLCRQGGWSRNVTKRCGTSLNCIRNTTLLTSRHPCKVVATKFQDIFTACWPLYYFLGASSSLESCLYTLEENANIPVSRNLISTQGRIGPSGFLVLFSEMSSLDTIFVTYRRACVLTHKRTKPAFLILEEVNSLWKHRDDIRRWYHSSVGGSWHTKAKSRCVLDLSLSYAWPGISIWRWREQTCKSWLLWSACDFRRAQFHYSIFKEI